MTDKVVETPAPEPKKPEETKPSAPAAPAAPAEPKKIGEVVNPTAPKAAEDTVGLDKYLTEKTKRKEAEKEIAELKKRIEDGETAVDLAPDINSLADEFGIDKKFLGKLVSSIETRAQKKAEAEVKPLKEKEKAAELDRIFKENFDEAMASMPEYKDIADADVIKSLSFDPKNKDLTFAQLIEKTYSKAIGGKRTIETTTPGGGKEPQEIDYKRAKSDGAYFKEIMANPALKKKYNEGLTDRIQSHL